MPVDVNVILSLVQTLAQERDMYKNMVEPSPVPPFFQGVTPTIERREDGSLAVLSLGSFGGSDLQTTGTWYFNGMPTGTTDLEYFNATPGPWFWRSHAANNFGEAYADSNTIEIPQIATEP